MIGKVLLSIVIAPFAAAAFILFLAAIAVAVGILIIAPMITYQEVIAAHAPVWLAAIAAIAAEVFAIVFVAISIAD